MNTPVIPLQIVAGEVGCDTNVLAARLGDEVIADPIGVRCCTVDLARQLIADHRARLQAERDRRTAQEAERRRQPHPLRERVRALQRAQERFEGTDLPALAVMMAGDLEGRLEASGRHLDELLTGESHFHSFTGKEAQ